MRLGRWWGQWGRVPSRVISGECRYWPQRHRKHRCVDLHFVLMCFSWRNSRCYFHSGRDGKSNPGADDGTYRLILVHLGSDRRAVNVGTGEIIQQLDYDDYGNKTLGTNPGFQPLGFADGFYDSHHKKAFVILLPDFLRY
jgi:hypothetical protein